MNKREAYRLGKERGCGIATVIPIREVGSDNPYVGTEKDIETKAEAAEIFFMDCNEAEDNDRQYSPFEFMAKDLNDSRDPESYWNEFEKGIQVGFKRGFNDKKRRLSVNS